MIKKLDQESKFNAQLRYAKQHHSLGKRSEHCFKSVPVIKVREWKVYANASYKNSFLDAFYWKEQKKRPRPVLASFFSGDHSLTLSRAKFVQMFLQAVDGTTRPGPLNPRFIYNLRVISPLDLPRRIRLDDLIPSIPEDMRLQAKTGALSHRLIYDLRRSTLSGLLTEILTYANEIEVLAYDDSIASRIRIKLLQ